MNTLESAMARDGLRARIHEFFYRPEAPYGLAIVRILMTLTLLCCMVPRWPFARELFSSDGAPTPLWLGYDHAPLFPEPSGPLAVAVESVLVLTLLTSCIGWCTRISLVIAAGGYMYLNILDTISTMTKYSVIAGHVMFLLSCSQCGALWSVDNWLRRSRLRRSGVPPELADQPRQFAAWPRRLMQLLFGAIYFGAAVTKMHTPAFFTGEQLQTWMITEYNVPNLLGSRFAMHPSLLVIFAYVSVVWEIVFIFLAWRGPGRIIMLSTGILFHFMTCLTLGLFIFPMVCTFSYFAFLNERDVEKIRHWWGRRRAERRPVPSLIARVLRSPVRWSPSFGPVQSQAAFAAVAVCATAGGLGLEHWVDPYGIRRPTGPHALVELDPQYVAEVIGPTKRIQNEDKLLSFDVGTIVVGGALLDRRTQFRQGETLRAQCGLLPPHEAMWVECNLHDWDDRVVNTIGVKVSNDSMRATFYYNIGDCVMPGEYSVVLKIAGEEIMRRPITIVARTTGPVAN